MKENKIQTKGEIADAKGLPKQLQPINQGRQEKPYLLFWMMLMPSLLVQASFIFTLFLVIGVFYIMLNFQSVAQVAFITFQQWGITTFTEVVTSFFRFKFDGVIIHDLAVIMNWARVFLFLTVVFFYIKDKVFVKKK